MFVPSRPGFYHSANDDVTPASIQYVGLASWEPASAKECCVMSPAAPPSVVMSLGGRGAPGDRTIWNFGLSSMTPVKHALRPRVKVY